MSERLLQTPQMQQSIGRENKAWQREQRAKGRRATSRATLTIGSYLCLIISVVLIGIACNKAYVAFKIDSSKIFGTAIGKSSAEQQQHSAVAATTQTTSSKSGDEEGWLPESIEKAQEITKALEGVLTSEAVQKALGAKRKRQASSQELPVVSVDNVCPPLSNAERTVTPLTNIFDTHQESHFNSRPEKKVLFRDGTIISTTREVGGAYNIELPSGRSLLYGPNGLIRQWWPLACLRRNEDPNDRERVSPECAIYEPEVSGDDALPPINSNGFDVSDDARQIVLVDLGVGGLWRAHIDPNDVRANHFDRLFPDTFNRGVPNDISLTERRVWSDSGGKATRRGYLSISSISSFFPNVFGGQLLDMFGLTDAVCSAPVCTPDFPRGTSPTYDPLNSACSMCRQGELWLFDIDDPHHVPVQVAANVSSGNGIQYDPKSKRVFWNSIIDGIRRYSVADDGTLTNEHHLLDNGLPPFNRDNGQLAAVPTYGGAKQYALSGLDNIGLDDENHLWVATSARSGDAVARVPADLSDSKAFEQTSVAWHDQISNEDCACVSTVACLYCMGTTSMAASFGALYQFGGARCAATYSGPDGCFAACGPNPLAPSRYMSFGLSDGRLTPRGTLGNDATLHIGTFSTQRISGGLKIAHSLSARGAELPYVDANPSQYFPEDNSALEHVTTLLVVAAVLAGIALLASLAACCVGKRSSTVAKRKHCQ